MGIIRITGSREAVSPGSFYLGACRTWGPELQVEHGQFHDVGEWACSGTKKRRFQL